MRPEDVELSPVTGERGGLAMMVTFVEHIGARTIVHLRGADHEVKVIERNDFEVDVGTPMDVSPKIGAGRLFDAASETALEIG